jgi:hypothetical protein
MQNRAKDYFLINKHKKIGRIKEEKNPFYIVSKAFYMRIKKGKDIRSRDKLIISHISKPK